MFLAFSLNKTCTYTCSLCINNIMYPLCGKDISCRASDKSNQSLSFFLRISSNVANISHLFSCFSFYKLDHHAMCIASLLSYLFLYASLFFLSLFIHFTLSLFVSTLFLSSILSHSLSFNSF